MRWPPDSLLGLDYSLSSSLSFCDSLFSMQIETPNFTCQKHTRRSITNYCYSSSCIKPLCPQCIEAHIKGHSAKGNLPDIETIQSSVSRSQKKLKLALDYLNSEFRTQTFPEEQVGQLQRSRKKLHQAIDHVFDELVKPSSSTSSYNGLVKRSIGEIELLISHLKNQQNCLQAVRRTFLLNLDSLWDQLNTLKTGRSACPILPSKIDQLLTMIRRLPEEDSIYSSPRPIEARQEFFVRPHLKHEGQTLSIQSDSHPRFLHYTSIPNKLFILKLPATHFLEYTTKTEVPLFSKSVLVEDMDWTVYLIGGISQTMHRKCSQIYRLSQRSASVAGYLREGRSSFSIATVNKRIYIVGGYTNTNNVTDLAQYFDIKTETVHSMTHCKIPSFNSTLVGFNSEILIKAGGSQGVSRLAHAIEVFFIRQNRWEIVEPLLDRGGPVPLLLSSMGAAQINEKQVIFFGGYNEERQSEPRKECFLLNCSVNKEFRLQAIGCLLPFEEGFWGESVVSENRVWALQNVADSESNDLIPDSRRLVNFDGKSWRLLR